MNEFSFKILCLLLFGVSFLVIVCVVLFNSPSEFTIEPYSTETLCSDGSCSLRGKIVGVITNNGSIFYKIEREVKIDAVLFEGVKKANFVVGDCVSIVGVSQSYKGRKSIVIQTVRQCDNKS